jgi:hypothetical protein
MAAALGIGLHGIYGSVIAAGISGILAAPFISRLLPCFQRCVAFFRPECYRRSYDQPKMPLRCTSGSGAAAGASLVSACGDGGGGAGRLPHFIE